MKDSFAVFICTHGRPTCQLTYYALRRCGYTGKIYLVLDDTDGTIQDYIDNFGPDDIIVFDKDHYINTCVDVGDNIGHYKCILYAKMAVEDIARSFNLKAFMLVDDDITNLRYRFVDGDNLRSAKIYNLDACLVEYVQFMLDCNIAGVGFGSPSMYYGSVRCYSPESFLEYRKVFQIYLRNVSYHVDWTHWYGEDNITLLRSGIEGNVWLQLPFIQYECVRVGNTSKSGGMVDIYKQTDPFLLAFNIKRAFPSCIRLTPDLVRLTPSAVKRTWLTVWKKWSAFPLIVSSSNRRVDANL